MSHTIERVLPINLSCIHLVYFSHSLCWLFSPSFDTLQWNWIKLGKCNLLSVDFSYLLLEHNQSQYTIDLTQCELDVGAVGKFSTTIRVSLIENEMREKSDTTTECERFYWFKTVCNCPRINMFNVCVHLIIHNYAFC